MDLPVRKFVILMKKKGLYTTVYIPLSQRYLIARTYELLFIKSILSRQSDHSFYALAFASLKKSMRNITTPAVNPQADTQNTVYQSFMYSCVVR